MQEGLTGKALSTELRTGLAFLTRLPLAPAAPVTGADISRASWTFPVIGAGVGLVAALVYWLAYSFGLQPFVAATLAVASTLAVTGCLHEDGLADTADGFGGGTTQERKLEIMRDSRIGSYGAAALIFSIMLRVGAAASLAEPALAAAALIAANAGARAAMPIFMRSVERARPDGLSAEAGAPPQESAGIALLIGLAIVWLCLGFSAMLLVLVLAAAALVLMAWLSKSQVGGQTGDVLGAVEQVSEVLILLVAAAKLQ
jgi:adenosylcobinamide-GDP ribazoletransferase